MPKHDQRVGEFVRIEGNGRSIEVVVEEIGGTKRAREATLRIIAPNSQEVLHIDSSSGLVEIAEGVKIEISRKPAKSERVALNFTFVTVTKLFIPLRPNTSQVKVR